MHQHKQKTKSFNNIQALQQQITLGPRSPVVVTVPTEIIVHLGLPGDDAENIIVPFPEYIKNVASSELYPTWPENALRANIYAITSVAMNRIYTAWYRLQNYNFDITNSTQFDQAYVPNSGVFENISFIVDDIFGQYIVREGQVQPLYAQFCDGRQTTCDGLHQWGTVSLAEEGYSPLEILQYYYGDNIQIVTNAPIGTVEEAYPGEPLRPGDSGMDILKMQYSLDRIALNYPGIPQINLISGFYDDSTEAAVREFQKIFNLPITGIIDEATWYRIGYIFVAVTRLAELTSEGLLTSELDELYSEILLEGDVRPSVEIVQFALNVLAVYYPNIPRIPITGIYDEQTANAVREFQKTMNLNVTGIADIKTMELMYRTVVGILDTLPAEQVYIPYLRWTGIVYSLGHESPGVYLFQEMLSYISLIIPTIPYVEPTGLFDEATQNAVIAFQNVENLEPTGIVDEQTWNRIVEVYRKQRFSGTNASNPI